jgi:hypothetical protein
VRKVRYHPEARAEFLHEVEYLTAISARLAQHYDNAVRNAEEQAANSPESWPKYKHRTRRVIDRRFKFSLVYLHDKDEIHIVAVAPMKRKPGYWRRRLAVA